MRSSRWPGRPEPATSAPLPHSFPSCAPGTPRWPVRSYRQAAPARGCWRISRRCSRSWKLWPRDCGSFGSSPPGPPTTSSPEANGSALACSPRCWNRAGPRRSTSMPPNWCIPTRRSVTHHLTWAVPTEARSDCCCRCSPADMIPVVPGFLGVTPAGEVTTLGTGRLRPHRYAAGACTRRLSRSRSGRMCPGCSPLTLGSCRMRE